MGARGAGLGYTSATLGDEWALFNNVGGLAKIQQTVAAFAYDRNASLPGGDRMAAVFTTPFKNGGAGLSLFRFGDELYSEQIIAAGYSNKFGIASLGLKLNYIQYSNSVTGTTHAFSVGFGGIASITPQLSVGAYITNINQPSLSKKDHEQLPTQLTAGISFRPNQNFLIAVEVMKDLDYSPVLKAGIEYADNKKTTKKISFRTGLNLHPNAIYFGVGYLMERLRIDYAVSYSALLSFGQQVSITYRLKKIAATDVRP